jgi:hypothetical protein
MERDSGKCQYSSDGSPFVAGPQKIRRGSEPRWPGPFTLFREEKARFSTAAFWSIDSAGCACPARQVKTMEEKTFTGNLHYSSVLEKG